MNTNFSKSDLKTGMIVTCRNGEEYIVFLNVNTRNFGNNHQKDLLINKDGYCCLSEYTDDLFLSCYKSFNFKKDDYDIMKVEKANCPSAIFSTINRTLLFERKNTEDAIKLPVSEVFNLFKEKYGDSIIEINLGESTIKLTGEN